MKVHKMNEKTGKLLVMNNVGRLEELLFDMDTLFYWYPCNPRYDYKLSSKRKKLYITLVEDNPNLPYAYNVTTCKGRANSEIACFYTDCWYNEEVWEENEKLFNLAKRLGFLTPMDNYSVDMVESELSNVANLLDYIYRTETERVKTAIENGEYTDQEIRENYSTADREDRASFILQNCPQTVVETYALLGEIYTMLSLMRKVAR